jgi:N-acyl-D-aspartate/D-glutamate deacylase
MNDDNLHCDVLLTSGRIIDPETGLDATGEVGIRDGKIVHVRSYADGQRPGDQTVESRDTVDAAGYVITPGFIDLHSHAQSATSLRLQSLDGVTTSLDLEAGALPAGRANARSADEGRPINFGFSASWALVVIAVDSSGVMPR